MFDFDYLLRIIIFFRNSPLRIPWITIAVFLERRLVGVPVRGRLRGRRRRLGHAVWRRRAHARAHAHVAAAPLTAHPVRRT